MTDWQRLESVIKYCGLTTNAFAKSIGYNRAELLYRIERGENGISKKLASDITIKYCNISEAFLLTGTGQMLKQEVIETNQTEILTKKDEEMENLRMEITRLKDKLADKEEMISVLKDRIEGQKEVISSLMGNSVKSQQTGS